MKDSTSVAIRHSSFHVLRPLVRIDLPVKLLGPVRQQHIQPEADEAREGHHDEDHPVAVRSHADITPALRLRGLSVVQNAGEQAGEEEGAKGKIEDEDVVDEAVVLEPEQL